MVQTINNPDGTVSIIHMDPNSAVVTLPDGTQAQVRAVSALRVFHKYNFAFEFFINKIIFLIRYKVQEMKQRKQYKH